MRSAFLIFVCFFSSCSLAGHYHVCTDANGKKSFQAMPCNDTEQAEVREYEVRKSLGNSGPSVELPTDSDIYKQMKADNRRAQLKRDIRKSELAIERYQGRMTAEMAALRSRKVRANNNLAGATWEQSISAEMQAVSDKYGNLIDVERDRLGVLRKELMGI